MLDEKDLQAIARLILDSEERTNRKFESLENRIESLENRMENLENRLDSFEKITEQRFNNLETRIDRLEERLKDTTEVLVEEIGRVQVYLEKQITEVGRRLDNVEEYYKI